MGCWRETAGLIQLFLVSCGPFSGGDVIAYRWPDKPVFGQYAFGVPHGALLKVGDEVTIEERS